MRRAARRDGTRDERLLRVLAGLLLVLLALAFAADTLIWFRLQHRLDVRVREFSDAAARAGWVFQSGAGQRGGWPLEASLVVHGPRLEAAAGGWSGETLVLEISPLHPHRLTASLLGTQTIRVGTARFRAWAATLRLRCEPERVLVDADAPHLARAGAGPDDVLQAAGLRAELNWPADRPDRTDLTATLRELALPLPLGPVDARIVRRARLSASWWPSQPGRPGQPGRLRLDEASIDWGDSGALLSGQAGLDAASRLDGGFTLDLTRPELAVAALRRGGAIDAGHATAILAVLGLIQDADPPPAVAGRLRLTLSLRAGVLRLGALPLLEIPPLRQQPP